MKIKKTYIVIFLLSTMISTFIILASHSTINSRDILELLSQLERNHLEQLCQYLIKETEFGYTLFGNKPMSCLFLDNRISDIDLRLKYREKLTIYRALPILKKVLSKLPSKNFILGEYKQDDLYILYLINKEAVRKIVTENRKLFEQCNPTQINLDQLLQMVLTETYLSQLLHNGNTCLLGIVLGYGTQNAHYFYQRQQIENTIENNSIPPWNFLKSSKLSELQAELYSLEKKQCPTINYSTDNISTIRFPMFACDPESQETKDLLKKYKEHQRLLKHIYTTGDVTAQFVEKFTYNNL